MQEYWCTPGRIVAENFRPSVDGYIRYTMADGITNVLTIDTVRSSVLLGVDDDADNAYSSRFRVVKSGGECFFVNDTYYESVSGGGVAFGHARGTKASPAALLTGDNIATLFLRGHTGAGWNNTALIKVFAAENFSSTNKGSYVEIHTTKPGSGGWRNPRLKINEFGVDVKSDAQTTGNVGYFINGVRQDANWTAAYTHKTTEDALIGLVVVDGAGNYSAVTDNSSNWNTAYGWGDPSGVYLPLSGGTLSGNLSLTRAIGYSPYIELVSENGSMSIQRRHDTTKAGYITVSGGDPLIIQASEVRASGYVDSVSGYKANGTSPVADNTYTMGKGSIADGTMTTKGGIITTVVQASGSFVSQAWDDATVLALSPSAWYDADDNRCIEGNVANACLCTWRDKSGSAGQYVATNSTGSTQPYYYFRNIGNRARGYVSFTNGNSMLTVQNNLNSLFTGSDKPLTFFAVIKTAAAVTGYRDIFGLYGATSTPLMLVRTSHNGDGKLTVARRDDANNLITAQGGVLSASTAYLIEVVFDGTTVSSWINGSADMASVAMDVGTITFSGASIGNTNSGNYCLHEIWEMIIFNSALSTANRQSIETYLNSKWSIY